LLCAKVYPRNEAASQALVGASLEEIGWKGPWVVVMVGIENVYYLEAMQTRVRGWSI
jgi:hypothetical protein